MRRGNQCKKCYDVDHPPKVKKDYKLLARERAAAEVLDTRLTVVGLEGFMAERRARIASRKAS